MNSLEALRNLKSIIFYVSETLVTESKYDITAEIAVDRIRKYLNNNYDKDNYIKVLKDLERLEKLEKVIEIFKDYFCIKFYDVINGIHFENYREKISLYSQFSYDEDYELLKEVLNK